VPGQHAVSDPWTPPGQPARRGGDSRRTTTIAVVVAVVVVAFLLHTHRLSRFTLVYFAVLIPSIILHEVSHGVVANALGDDTAKRAGRLTLNPVAHVDPLGSIIVPGLLVLTSNVAFGWAKPVPVNVGRLRHPRNGSVLVSLAGPFTNGILFAACALAFRYLLSHGLFLPPTGNTFPLGYQFLLAGGLANITVGVFNLIPLPPLDGSAVVERLVPDRHLQAYYRIRPYGMVIVFLFAIFVLQSSQVGAHLFGYELKAWNAVAGTNFA
jgi:Zn-dependent protease